MRCMHLEKLEEVARIEFGETLLYHCINYCIVPQTGCHIGTRCFNRRDVLFERGRRRMWPPVMYVGKGEVKPLVGVLAAGPQK